ncbi:MAG TPA: GAP family protein [Actinomycetes bacterium]
MDLAAVLTLALLALFLAVQPWSVLAAILLVTARGGVKKELAYAGGWVVALAVVAVVTVLVYPNVPQTSTTSQGHAVVELAVGLFLGGWLLRRWRHPRDAGTDSQPSWMARLDTMSPLLAFGLGAFLPTYAVVVAAVSEMLSSGLAQGWLLVAALGWVLVASTGVASPLLVLVTDRDHAPQTYQRWRVWIVAHSRAVLYGVGGLVCLVLVTKGIVGLLG